MFEDKIDAASMSIKEKVNSNETVKEHVKNLENAAYVEFIGFDQLGGSNLTRETKMDQTKAAIIEKLTPKKETALKKLVKTAKYGNSMVRGALGWGEGDISNGVMKAQYNPTSLKLTYSLSQGGPDSQAAEGRVKSVSTQRNVELSVSLVFYKGALDKSVEENMNAALRFLRESPTKNVRFTWSNTCVEGKLTRFEGSYDMFDISGNPTKGSIKLTILQGKEEKKR